MLHPETAGHELLCEMTAGTAVSYDLQTGILEHAQEADVDRQGLAKRARLWRHGETSKQAQENP